METKRMRWIQSLACLAGLAVLAGCGPDPVKSISEAPSGKAAAQEPFVPKAEAGVRREPGDPAALIKEASAQQFVVRADPFSLRPNEISYDRSQFAASMNASMGWYPNIAEEPVEATPTLDLEPQPPRRLAGILVGESITALIDMGDGSGLQPIRPGQEIKSGSTTWVVQSIDEEKAILRRVGDDKRPKYVVVRLEDSATMTTTPTGGGTGGGGGNRRGGGAGDGGGGRGAEAD